MSPAPADLLRLLASGLGGSAAPAPRADLAHADFADLLQRARAGEFTPRPVDVDPAVSLAPDQLARLAAAADRAEMTGASRAGILLDGRLLTLDVASRRVTGEVAPGSPPSPLDAVIPADPPAPDATPAPASTFSPASHLLRGLRGLI